MLVFLPLLCVFVACNSEEQSSAIYSQEQPSEEQSSIISQEQSSSSSEQSEEPIISSGKWDFDRVADSSVLLNGVSMEWFNSYTTIFGGKITMENYKKISEYEKDSMLVPYFLKVISNYEDFLDGVINEDILNTVTEDTFKNNYVVIVQGEWWCSRYADMCYNDFKKENGYHTLSFNRIVEEHRIETAATEPYVDIVVIPRELFGQEDPNTVEIKLLYKEYVFESAEEIYNSSCYENTYLPE